MKAIRVVLLVSALGTRLAMEMTYGQMETEKANSWFKARQVADAVL